jgi:hypothetical protein
VRSEAGRTARSKDSGVKEHPRTRLWDFLFSHFSPLFSRRPPAACLPAKAARSKNFSIAMLVLALVWIGPILACGSFQPRPTSTPQPAPLPAQNTTVREQPSPPPTRTAMPPPTATVAPTATLVVSTWLTIGEPARISVDGGLNIREQPNTNAPIVTRLAFGKLVVVLGGPTAAEGYVWWKVDDGQGSVGWVAAGQGNVDWITPRIGEAQPVNRTPVIGDRVVVTLNGELTVRALPGTGAASVLVALVGTNRQFTVVAGPQSVDGYIWFQIRSDDGQLEGWAADGERGERWLSPLE